MTDGLRRFLKGVFESALPSERSRAIEAAADRLSPEIRELRHQWLGRSTPGCAATYGVQEACDFSCTACYLSNTANQTPPLPFEAVASQLEQIRAFTGPSGNVQLTAGEVTLLPRGELKRIVRYARDIGLDPMLMTHGETFATDPTYLRVLMEAGLEKVAIHVDSTQRGRPGHGRETTEAGLMSVRDRFAELVRSMRRMTSRTLHAAHTVTVTHDNLHAIPDITRWWLRNADAFRMLSLQPTAEVGRTRDRAVRGDSVWDMVCEGVGHRLNPHTFLMGHPDCNSVCLAFVVRFGDEIRVVEVKREQASVDAWFVDQLSSGAFMGFYIDGVDTAELLGRIVRLFASSPAYLWQWPAYCAYRLLDGNLDWVPRFARAIAMGEPCRIDPAVIVIHNFMSREELDTDLGRSRLAACSFRVPVDGEMVSMCELNATDLRRDLNLRLQRDPDLVHLRNRRSVLA